MSDEFEVKDPDTGEELDHYEWAGWWWCENEQEAFDWETGEVECPHCGDTFHSPDPQSERLENGIYRKYRVEKDGEPVEECFVLEPQNDPAARKALLEYSKVTDDRELSDDIEEWIDQLEGDGLEDDTRVGHSPDSSGRIPLKFDSGPRSTLTVAYKHDSLAATVRYADEKGISEGDEIDLISSLTGDKFGTATVEHTETVEVRHALGVIHNWWAEYGITQTDTLVKRLNVYFDDVITNITEVKVMILDPEINPPQVGMGR